MCDRDDWVIVRTIGDLTIQVEAHFDPQAELYNMVVSRNGRIVDVEKVENLDVFISAHRAILSAIMLHEDETKEPTPTLDGAASE